MNTNTLVSVVIPAYNAEKYIRECLDSALAQTYTNLEIIIIIDGSKDNTEIICKEYADKDSRIKYLWQENAGVSAARNRGIQMATGDYIVFWDYDDFAEPDLVERFIDAYKYWEGKPVTFVTCGMFFDNKYNKNVGNKVSVLESGLGYVKDERYLMIRSTAAVLAWLKLFNFVTNKCYDLKKIKEYGICFNEDVRIGEDLEFNLNYLDKVEGSIGMVNRALYHYVKRTSENLSISYHEGDMEDTKVIYRRFIKWEKKQLGATYDNVMVIKGIYITDWVSRMTSMYHALHKTDKCWEVRRALRKELTSSEFKVILDEVHKAGKISTLRYMCLKTGSFVVFYFVRAFYQIIKG